MKINLHIERLVLEGFNFDPEQRDLLQRTVTTELTRMLAQDGVSLNIAQGKSLPRLPTADIQLADNIQGKLGQQIAHSVYGGIGYE